MHRIQWSCEGLTSVHNKYTGYTFEAFIAETYVQLVATGSNVLLAQAWWLWDFLLLIWLWRVLLLECVWQNAPTLYCVVPYIAACVDISRTVFWDRSKTSLGMIRSDEYKYKFWIISMLEMSEMPKQVWSLWNLWANWENCSFLLPNWLKLDNCVIQDSCQERSKG